ncbi:hypothetical protein LUZ60_013397 [Juncus effusus]|nr:hypothetical protein LUZ60_013397 [Juncus effusus]
MKREGRHHGNAKSQRSKTPRYIEKLPAIGGFESRAVVTRPAPSNGSKFTGKCKKARCKSCHYHPVTKSKDKTKGTYKLKSCDVALNHKLVSWRIAGDDLGMLKYKGVSASAVLKDLAGSVYSSNYSCEEAGEKEEVGFDVEYNYDQGFDGSNSNTVDNANNLLEASDDFIGFGGLFDEIEFGYNKLADNSDDFVGFGALFDEIGTEPRNLMIEEIEQDKGIESELELDSDAINGENDGIENPAFENSGFETEEEGEDEMGFYIVGVVKEFSDNEDWLVVEEM